MWSLEVSIYSVMLSAYRDSFAVSLLTWMPLVSFSFLIAVSRTSSTAFNRSGESGPPCLVQILAGSLVAFHCRVLYGCGLGISSFYYVELRSLYGHSGKSFYHERMLNSVSCVTEMIVWFPSFLLLMCFITLVDLCMLNHPCEIKMNPGRPFYLLLDLLIFCLRFFAFIFFKDIGL